MVKNGGRQGTNGLCIVTKTNAWKTVRCESVEAYNSLFPLPHYWYRSFSNFVYKVFFGGSGDKTIDMINGIYNNNNNNIP